MKAEDFLRSAAQAIVRIKVAQAADKSPSKTDTDLVAEAHLRVQTLPPDAQRRVEQFVKDAVTSQLDQHAAKIAQDRQAASDGFVEKYLEKRSAGILGQNSITDPQKIRDIAAGKPQEVEASVMTPGGHGAGRKTVGTKFVFPNDADQRRAAILAATMKHDGERIARGPTPHDQLQDLDRTPSRVADDSIAGDISRAVSFHEANPTAEAIS